MKEACRIVSLCARELSTLIELPMVHMMTQYVLFKIAGIGILVAVLNQVLAKAGREDQAMMTTLTGVVIVLMIVISQISTLFETVRSVFKL